ncbi:5'-methylthioadenosine/S-adenosylhomocysteine nucleosidase [Thermasporomyces composti]|jgi:8-oxo-dGTP diphosphatase|uniref:5'-methylthioadenosine/S-adenosylhomocysteine nucleosidase n=1 Tax=Thermasporomyces composti TaxID=696763 RepID=A0A3D9V1D1_THECX|nr:5'-methylthioadenosine/S-adenosylhomocysteine nucleosidase [Thermasporomyces composti]REF35206.1 5'-methylthioadenosine/S-adenosylhomocysteine nucleosidase [Thermasporomyces composti]
MSSCDVVILTALNLEYQAVRKKMRQVRVEWASGGTRFEVGQFGERCQVALGLVGKGNHSAAVLAERAIHLFGPAAVLFVGVAGALWPSVKLGDVVVASQVYAYHGATSEDDGLKARPRAWEIAHVAGQVVQHVARSDEWARDLADTPKVHFGPIAAGEVVHDSAISDQARWVREHYNDALAIEMEAAGVAQAAHLNRSLPVVVIRGISDRADGTKAATDAENWQPRAAAHAAAFAVALVDELVAAPRGDQANPMTVGATRARPEFARTAPEPRELQRIGPDGVSSDWMGSERFGVVHQNIATGNARVGIQAGTIQGSVVVGGDRERSIDLAADLADLRRLLERAYRDGRLDEESYAAATAELDVADDSLRKESPPTKALVALKKLRGLVADVADLAAKVATIIAVAKGLSS